eukprot:403333859
MMMARSIKQKKMSDVQQQQINLTGINQIPNSISDLAKNQAKVKIEKYNRVKIQGAQNNQKQQFNHHQIRKLEQGDSQNSLQFNINNSNSNTVYNNQQHNQHLGSNSLNTSSQDITQSYQQQQPHHNKQHTKRILAQNHVLNLPHKNKSNLNSKNSKNSVKQEDQKSQKDGNNDSFYFNYDQLDPRFTTSVFSYDQQNHNDQAHKKNNNKGGRHSKVKVQDIGEDDIIMDIEEHINEATESDHHQNLHKYDKFLIQESDVQSASDSEDDKLYYSDIGLLGNGFMNTLNPLGNNQNALNQQNNGILNNNLQSLMLSGRTASNQNSNMNLNQQSASNLIMNTLTVERRPFSPPFSQVQQHQQQQQNLSVMQLGINQIL